MWRRAAAVGDGGADDGGDADVEHGDGTALRLRGD